LEECHYYLILTKDLNYGDVSQLKPDLEEISKMLGSYMQKIRDDR
jgi:four helix bundle protein